MIFIYAEILANVNYYFMNTWKKLTSKINMLFAELDLVKFCKQSTSVFSLLSF